MTRRSLVLLALLGAVTLAPAVAAEGLQSHSVTYDVKPLKEAKDLYLEGQATFTLTRKCDGWTLGEILQLGIERG